MLVESEKRSKLCLVGIAKGQRNLYELSCKIEFIRFSVNRESRVVDLKCLRFTATYCGFSAFNDVLITIFTNYAYNNLNLCKRFNTTKLMLKMNKDLDKPLIGGE